LEVDIRLTIAQVGLERRFVRQSVAVNALNLETLVPAGRSVEDSGPRDHAADSSHVGDWKSLISCAAATGEDHDLQYPKAVPADPVAAAMNDKMENAPPKRTRTQGNPVLLVLRKILGA
jgi:hypothetical protein